MRPHSRRYGDCVKLNLGCGWDHREGYLNVDFVTAHRPDLVGDVLHLPLASGAATEVFAQDVLEHLPRTATEEALAEWRRVTAHGGVTRIRVPSLFHAVDYMRRAGTIDVHRLLLQNLYGTQAYTGDVHLTSFTDLTVSYGLHQAGFRSVQAHLVDDWMWDIRAYASDGPPVAVFWSDGFYEIESSAGMTWRWCRQHGEIVIVNTDSAPHTAQISMVFRFAHADPDELEVRVGDFTGRFPHGESLSRSVDLPPASRIVLAIDAPFDSVDAPMDPRSLYFQVTDAAISIR